jgi:20S proteasome subunit alpha 3
LVSIERKAVVYYVVIHVGLIGQNNQAGKSLLKTDFKEENSLATNVKLAVQILSKTMDSTTPSPDRIELSIMRRRLDGTVVHEMLPESMVRW